MGTSGRWITALATVGALSGGGVALAAARGAGTAGPTTRVATAARVTPLGSTVQLRQLTGEVAALQTAVDAARTRLSQLTSSKAAGLASEQAELSSKAAQLTAAEQQVRAEAQQLATEQARLEQEASALAAEQAGAATSTPASHHDSSGDD